MSSPEKSRVSVLALARGTVASNLAQAMRVIAGVVMVPLVIGRLGLEGYGSWIVLMALFTQLSAPTVGFHWAYAKFTAELARADAIDELAAILASGMIALTLPTAAVGTALWWSADWLLPLVGVPPAFLPEANLALGLLVASSVLRCIAGGAAQVLSGLQRADLRYLYDIVDALTYLVAAIVFLTAGYGLAALAGSVLLGQVVSFGLSFFSCRRLLPQLRWSPRMASRAALRRIVSLGGRFQLMMFLGEAALSGRAMAIGAVAGADIVGLFGLAERLTIVARIPANSISVPLMPAFVDLASDSDRARRQRVLRVASRLTVGAVLPVLGLVCVLAEPILRAWTGSSYPDAVTAIWALAFSSAVLTATVVPVTYLRAEGSVRLEMKTLVAEMVGMVGGAAMGFLLGGFAGILFAVVFVRVAARGWFLLRFDQGVDRGTLQHVRQSALRSIVATLPAVALVVIAAPFVLGDVAASSRTQLLAGLAALGVGYLALAVPANIAALLSAADRDALSAVLRPRSLNKGETTRG